MNVRMLHATGDGVTDDRPAIQSALEAAAVFGDDVHFPPGTYIVGRSGTNAWCLDMPGDNPYGFSIDNVDHVRFFGCGCGRGSLHRTADGG